jgi:hypothetical protein
MSTTIAELMSVDELDLDAIDAVTAGGSEKGLYEQKAIEFLESGKLGVPYAFSGKLGNSVKTGFETAFAKIAKNEHKEGEAAPYSAELAEMAKSVEIKVRKLEGTWVDDKNKTRDNEGVFLINQALVREAKRQREATAREAAATAAE